MEWRNSGHPLVLMVVNPRPLQGGHSTTQRNTTQHNFRLENIIQKEWEVTSCLKSFHQFYRFQCLTIFG